MPSRIPVLFALPTARCKNRISMTAMGSSSSYDEVPYTSFPYTRTHPDRLCALARLFGIEARQPSRARVLELGCAAGGNLIPMAEHLQDSRFVGVDLSATQIAEGQSLIAEVGLHNVELRHGSIVDVDRTWGQFDYVICHGVYSWVPAPVQAKILEICRDHLSPDGIGYVSYNTYPGWHLRESVRHMMRYHVEGFTDPKQRVAQARALVDFLAGAATQQEGPFGLLLKRELAMLARTGDDYLYHEHLEDQNEPLYFHQFAERLAGCGLQYLCESDLHLMLTREFPPAVRETLDRIAPDLLRMEQYADFLRNRQFRATLLCHREASPRRALGPDAIMGFRFGLAGKGDATPIDLSPGLPQRFETLEGLHITAVAAVTKAALLVLRNAWPGDVGFAELHQRAAAMLCEAGLASETEPSSRAALAVDLLECLVGGGSLELRVEPPALVRAPGPKPRASATTRVQARRWGFATNGRHGRVDLDRFTVELITRCDGTRDHEALLGQMLELVQAGILTVTVQGAALAAQDPSAAQQLTHLFETSLHQLARAGLFVA